MSFQRLCGLLGVEERKKSAPTFAFFLRKQLPHLTRAKYFDSMEHHERVVMMSSLSSSFYTYQITVEWME
jgi:hypothetical protein